ncbi:Alpha-L-fucosidase [Limihaloglobus sulfuriphilus]|uniref:alpha-L-fucosidase n=1 Tax=Limihaloglobus sulfuriphilus TaxID=1851148 RepID=A0A1Q2MBH2_9BACT|nr:alpha-L-fucosidase [Limihaloglobus sulfuriphilus]AQQ70046.1 Alpha-L-fucosidase [Limihaloglobus sulfuriphilus]
MREKIKTCNLFSFLLVCTVIVISPGDFLWADEDLGLPWRCSEQDIQWFTDAAFGMFIHWGPVSLTGGELSWSRDAKRPFDIHDGKPPSELDWNRTLTDKEKYDNLYKQFNPVKFDADEWAALAKDAGMKYMVFTAKHHDGFSNFHTRYSDYNIANTPFKRDIVKELAESCRRHKLKFGVYYSQRDWYHPAYLRGDNSEYEEFMFNQIRELLSSYGRIDIIWFDSFGESDLGKDWHIPELISMIRRLQPGILVNNRLAVLAGYNKGPRKYWGDFDTPEQRIGKYQPERAWESCITLAGHQWSWKPDAEMLSLPQCIDMLVSCVCGGGNLLLNVGPMPTGQIEPRQAQRLREIGSRLEKYGETLYNTKAGPFKPGDWGGSTQSGNRIYLHVKDAPECRLTLEPLERKIVSAEMFKHGSARFNQSDECVEITWDSNNNRYRNVIILTCGE